MADSFYPLAYGGGRIDFSPLADIGASIGSAIGDYRVSNQIKDAMGSAIGPDGAVNYDTLRSNLLSAGHVKAAKEVDKITGSSGNVFGTPVWGVDKTTGKEGVGTIGRDGRFHVLDTGNFQPQRGVDIKDLGYGQGAFSKGSGTLQGVTPQTGDLPSGYVPPPNYAPWGNAPANGVAPATQPGELPVYSSPQEQPNTGPSAGIPGVASLPSSVTPPPTGGYMPGSEPAMKAEKEARGIAEQKKAHAITQDIVSEDIGRARQLVSSNTTGLIGSVAANIPGTPAHDLQQIIEGIGANIGFDRLQQMRMASPTGGALGQVSDFENRLLQSVYGSLRQSQNKGQLDYNLRRLNNIYNKVINEGIKPGDPIPTGNETNNDEPGTPKVVDWKTYFGAQ